jgi:hypothetical protein
MHDVSEAVQYSRLLRPYSTKRMDGALWYVEATAGGIYQRKLKLLIDPPADPATWQSELELIQNDLQTLAEQCEDAWRKIGLLIKSAPGDYERAITAMTRVLQGISAGGPPEGTGEAPTLRAA